MTSKNLFADNAECHGRHDLFDGYDNEDANGNLIGYIFPHRAKAKAICAECPVSGPCLSKYKKATGVIIAGYTDEERRNL